ncbi:tRNA pseudouridine(55) synthase TruB [Helicovermis profundi]|uniref:tRNA pseudouridine synthase B n=1 Tax=Helicovermis profundi TaxID=3065157 RepID=A0AAU9EF18_9FIRM|nr:tRNA pseudouridine(55) synthase TruB [Clostridia bacterium S502]
MKDGVINFYKPQNMTSHDVVAIVRKKLKIKRVGHTGTLDPMAEGVLPICIGRATKIAEYLVQDKKKYRCEISLGITTDTQDKWGKELIKRDVNVTSVEMTSCIKSFIGEIEQIPPMYSALKHKGKKLYELAREGITVERKPRKRTIFNIDIISIDEKTASFDVECSKGTYIRTLCYDIGEKLGCGAHMSALTRISSGNFTIENVVTIEAFKEMTYEQIDKLIVTADNAVSNFKKIYIKNEVLKQVLNGVKFNLLDFQINNNENSKYIESEKVLVYDSKKFLGIANYRLSDNSLKMDKLFFIGD